MSKRSFRISQHSEKFESFHELEGDLACDLNGQFLGNVTEGSFCGSQDFDTAQGGDMEPDDYVLEAYDRLVEEMTKELPPKERETFIAIYLDCLSQTVHAKTQGVTRQTVHARLLRIRKKLQKKINSDPFWVRFQKWWQGE